MIYDAIEQSQQTALKEIKSNLDRTIDISPEPENNRSIKNFLMAQHIDCQTCINDVVNFAIERELMEFWDPSFEKCLEILTPEGEIPWIILLDSIIHGGKTMAIKEKAEFLVGHVSYCIVLINSQALGNASALINNFCGKNLNKAMADYENIRISIMSKYPPQLPIIIKNEMPRSHIDSFNQLTHIFFSFSRQITNLQELKIFLSNFKVQPPNRINSLGSNAKKPTWLQNQMAQMNSRLNHALYKDSPYYNLLKVRKDLNNIIRSSLNDYCDIYA